MEHAARKLIEILRKNNIQAHFAKDRMQVFEIVMSLIPEGSVVGLGDSLTLRQIGVVDTLERENYTFLNPWKPGNTVEENIKLKKQALISGIFVTGSNALTLGGKIVTTTGTGTVSPRCFSAPIKF